MACALLMSCSKMSAIDENRHELSSGTTYSTQEGAPSAHLRAVYVLAQGQNGSLTRCIRYPLLVKT